MARRAGSVEDRLAASESLTLPNGPAEGPPDRSSVRAALLTWPDMSVMLARPSHSTALSKWTLVFTSGLRNSERVDAPGGACGSLVLGRGPNRSESCGATVKL